MHFICEGLILRTYNFYIELELVTRKFTEADHKFIVDHLFRIINDQFLISFVPRTTSQLNSVDRIQDRRRTRFWTVFRIFISICHSKRKVTMFFIFAVVFHNHIVVSNTSKAGQKKKVRIPDFRTYSYVML